MTNILLSSVLIASVHSGWPIALEKKMLVGSWLLQLREHLQVEGLD